MLGKSQILQLFYHYRSAQAIYINIGNKYISSLIMQLGKFRQKISHVISMKGKIKCSIRFNLQNMSITFSLVGLYRLFYCCYLAWENSHNSAQNYRHPPQPFVSCLHTYFLPVWWSSKVSFLEKSGRIGLSPRYCLNLSYSFVSFPPFPYCIIPFCLR